MSFMNHIKGWIGEKATQASMWLLLDDKDYRRYNDIILQAPNGTTQIDHVVVSRFGIFVIETKNYQGWIFGGATQKEWTQSLYGKKNRFQNPLHQNFRHTKALAEHLSIDHEKIFPIIWFVGDVTFKTAMPPNVLASGLIPYIKEHDRELFADYDLMRIEALLMSLKDEPAASTREHVAALKERYDSDSVCPKCGGALVSRTARSGANAGKSFLGCSGFPKCRYVKNNA